MKKNKLYTIAAFSSLTVGSIYGINKLISVLATATASLSNPNGLKYDWRFGKIFYTKSGQGKPILLIHDITCGSSDTEWTAVVKKYSKNHTVYTIDLLGCGRSDKPAITYTNYLYVQLITDFIKNVIGHRTDVVATGMASNIVTMACYNDSTLFDKIMLINPPSTQVTEKSNPDTKKLAKLLIELPLIGTLIYNIKNSRQSYRTLLKESYYSNPYAVRTSYVRNYYDAAHLSGMTAKYLFASIETGYLNTNTSRAVKAINNSIYIVSGQDEFRHREIVDEYLELNPSIEHVVIKNTKHLPQLENPIALTECMDIFFG